jgi:DNA-binding NarL/FixJ family response regulator
MTSAAAREAPIRLVIVAGMRLYREGLISALSTVGSVVVVGSAMSRSEAHNTISVTQPDVVLVDVFVSDATELVDEVAAQRSTKIVVLAPLASETELLRFVEAGAVSCVDHDATIADLIQIVLTVAAGGLLCSPVMAAAVLRRIRVPGGTRIASRNGRLGNDRRLTQREHEVADLVARGLANKEIASTLGIRVSTVKNHVHSVLDKLDVVRRSQMASRLSEPL